MIKVVGIRFQRAGKIYYFDPLDYDLETAMHVIVETARGVEMGTVLIPPKEVEDDKVIQPLKPVIRVATDEDEKVMERNKEKEAEAYVICKEKIAKHGLEMKLVAAEYTFDNNKLLFYFTADGRIDFRELVWHLYFAHVLNCVRSVCVMRQRCWEESVSVEESFAANRILQTLFRYRSRWQRNRIFH